MRKSNGLNAARQSVEPGLKDGLKIVLPQKAEVDRSGWRVTALLPTEEQKDHLILQAVTEDEVLRAINNANAEWELLPTKDSNEWFSITGELVDSDNRQRPCEVAGMKVDKTLQTTRIWVED